MNLVGRVLVVLLISALIIALLPLNALAQIVKTVPKEEQAAPKPLIWHADYHLNYLTLHPGAQGLGEEQDLTTLTPGEPSPCGLIRKVI